MAKRVVNFAFNLITLRISVWNCVMVPLLDCGSRLCGSLHRREFSFCTRWAELGIFVNKHRKKASTFSFFCLTEQKGSLVLTLLIIQYNSTSSVLINHGTLDVEIREFKPGAAAPST